MTQDIHQAVATIDSFMRQVGGTKGDWYVGISAKPRQRLFDDHAVHEQLDAWILQQTLSSDIARAVEKAYLDTGHCGGPGGGDSLAIFVYAYRKSTRTRP